MRTDQRKRVEVCFSPRQFELYKDSYEICVVIDVLRATSAICAGIENGVKEIIPVSTIEDAQRYKDDGYIVAAERGGEIVNGFDFGNSPYSFLDPKLKGKSVVLTTTNGTKAINIAKSIPTVVIGSLNNLDSVCKWLLSQNKNVLLLGSGWKDKCSCF